MPPRYSTPSGLIFGLMKVETLASLGEVYQLLGEPAAEWALEEALTLSEAKGNIAAAAAIIVA